MDTCLVCSTPIEQLGGRGHRKRQYCGDACRKREQRRRQGAMGDGPRRLPKSAQIEVLENKVEQLQERLDVESRFRIDTGTYHFKRWLRSHDYPRDTDFFKRFLADGKMPEHASRGTYEAKLRVAGYSDEDRYRFQDAWKSMLFASQ